jgi:serine protease Do
VTPSIVSVILTKIDTVTLTKHPFFNYFDDKDSGAKNPFDRFFGTPDRSPRRSERQRTEKREYREQGLGSGVIISQDGYVLTNYHVVAGANEIQVRLPDDRSFEAVVIGIDSLSDVAVIKIKEKVKNLPAANLGDDLKLRPGDWVLAIGNPFSLTSSVTLGIVSALHRQVGNSNLYQNFIQTDAAINPGNSGGALVNIDGEVIGVNTMIYSQTGGFMGVGFAIPVSMAKKVMEDLITKGKVVRGWIGVSIQEMNEPLRVTLNLGERKGALVSDVFKNQPADKAGMRRGDVVIAVAGKNIENPNQLRNYVAELQPGSKVHVTVIRGGREMSLHLSVEERSDKMMPKPEKETPQKTGLPEGVIRSEKRFGLSLSDQTPSLRARYGIRWGVEGIVVTGTDNSLADARASFQEGDVVQQVKTRDKDYQTVGTITLFDEALKNAKKGDPITLVAVRKSSSLFIGFNVP